MAAWGVLVQGWRDVLVVSGTPLKAALVGGEVIIAAALFVLTAAALRCEEWAWTLDLLRRGGSKGLRGGGRL
jgi:hypothetical protein